MKKTIFLLAALLIGAAGHSQNQKPAGDTREPVVKANYALAERFSAKKVNQMVFSTRITPEWFKSGDKFWYEWKTSEGTHYYIVDPAKGSKSEVFDMDRLAMQVTQIVRYPFDSKHIPLKDLKLKDDKTFTFNIVSGLKNDCDTTYFRYEIASGKLDTVSKETKKYPDWAAVSPDGTIGEIGRAHV